MRGTVTVQQVTTDRYGRIVAIVRANGVNMSCYQIRQGVARYIVKYDTGGVIAGECR